MAGELADLLRPIGEEIQRMDASAKEAHGFAVKIRRLMTEEVFSADGLLNPADYKDSQLAFEIAYRDEDEEFEVYADDLGRYYRRRNMDLSVTQSDEDKRTLIRARREYVGKLKHFHSQVQTIRDYLDAQNSRPDP